MVGKIYENIGYQPEYSIPEGMKDQNGKRIRKESYLFPETNSVVKTKVTAPKGIAYIHIPQYGADVVRKVHEQLKDLCLKHIEAIYLYLDLQDPLTYYLTSEFENLGFFFGGVFPGQLYGKDALVLQYLNNVPIAYERISIDSDFAQELKDYIEQNDPNKRID